MNSEYCIYGVDLTVTRQHTSAIFFEVTFYWPDIPFTYNLYGGI
jgi:hypothetical protein